MYADPSTSIARFLCAMTLRPPFESLPSLRPARRGARASERHTRGSRGKGQGFKALLLAAMALLWTSGAWADCSQGALQTVGTLHWLRIEPLTTLLGRDGQRWRLAGLQVVDEPGAAALIKALGERELRAFGDQRFLDRYERLWAYLWAGDIWLQALLVEAGVAVAWPREGQIACHDVLVALESSARQAKRGIWRDWPRSVTAAKQLGELARGQFVLLEGRVKSVGKTSSRVYLNFGTDYSSDTSAIIAQKHLKRFRSAGIELDKLAGKDLRLRGFLDQRNGPSLTLAFPEQIEQLD